MTPLEVEVVRETFMPPTGEQEGATLGRCYADHLYLGYTLEDEDRHLEDHLDNWQKEKVYGRTAIPCGRYKLVLDWSPHFGKILPHILDVPTHTGVRFHGANDASELLGCIALGQARTARGVARCGVVVERLVALLGAAERDGRDAFLTVRRLGD